MGWRFFSRRIRGNRHKRSSHDDRDRSENRHNHFSSSINPTVDEIIDNLYTLDEMRHLSQNDGSLDPNKTKRIVDEKNLVNNAGIDVGKINFIKSIKVPDVDEDTLKRLLRGGV